MIDLLERCLITIIECRFKTYTFPFEITTTIRTHPQPEGANPDMAESMVKMNTYRSELPPPLPKSDILAS
jgi:hypothetical protein